MRGNGEKGNMLLVAKEVSQSVASSKQSVLRRPSAKKDGGVLQSPDIAGTKLFKSATKSSAAKLNEVISGQVNIEDQMLEEDKKAEEERPDTQTERFKQKKTPQSTFRVENITPERAKEQRVCPHQ